jgi:hypothetical protein
MQLLDAQGALACLCGQQGRWLVRRSAVTIGRSTGSKGDVDIDLSTPQQLEAAAGASRQAGAAPAPAAGTRAAPGAEAVALAAAAAAAGQRTPAAAEQAPPAAGTAGALPGATAGGAGAGSSSSKQVSRLQAQLLLTADGCWSLHNTGRAPLSVNGQQVRVRGVFASCVSHWCGCHSARTPHILRCGCVALLQVARDAWVPLPHLSLVEAADTPLLFMVNSLAVGRAVARSTHLTM